MSRLRRWKRAELACGEIFQGAKTAVEFGGSAAEAVKAGAAFAIVNGFAERPSTQEIRGFEGRGRRLPGGARGSRGQCRAIFARAEGADLLGQAHLDEVAGFAAFEQAQRPSSSRRRTACRTGPLDRPRSRAT